MFQFLGWVFGANPAKAGFMVSGWWAGYFARYLIFGLFLDIIYIQTYIHNIYIHYRHTYKKYIFP